MKYLVTISYDGSKFNGLQKLKNEKTVQGELERVLSKVDEEFVSVKAAGRTDKGVHALEQICHFELKKELTPFRLRYYINRSTSPYIYVKDCTIIEDKNFHARFSVKSKTYLYKINVGEYDSINADYVYNYNRKLDIDRMKDASKLLLGSNNYKAFVTEVHKTYDSVIDYIDVKKNSDLIEIEVKGKAFYTHMLRNIVGVLILVGANKIAINDVQRMLDEQKRIVEYATAPACGLYLKKIDY